MTYEIEITRRCNFSCPGCDHLCNIVKDPTSDMTMDDVESIVAQINEVDPNKNCIRIIGGEPTLHSQCYEICQYVKNNIENAKLLEIYSNHTNNALLDVIKADLGFNVRMDDGRDPKGTLVSKIIKHRNPYISPKADNLASIDSSPYNCFALSSCGIDVHKWRGSLVWSWCPPGSSVCKMLKKEEYLKPTLRKLLASDFSKYADEVCGNCFYRLRTPVYMKDSKGTVSSCFKEGLEDLKKYNEELNSQQTCEVDEHGADMIQ